MEAKAVGELITENCILKNVILVPKLTKNLLFVNVITDKDGEVKFTKDKVEILLNKRNYLKGSRGLNGLYVIDIKKANKMEGLLILNSDTLQWHQKLGHSNMEKLTSLSEGINSPIIKKFAIYV